LISTFSSPITTSHDRPITPPALNIRLHTASRHKTDANRCTATANATRTTNFSNQTVRPPRRFACHRAVAPGDKVHPHAPLTTGCHLPETLLIQALSGHRTSHILLRRSNSP